MTLLKYLFGRSIAIIPVLSICLWSCKVDIPEPVSIAYDNLPEEVDFNFHVRPILSDRCYSCHGPDEEARKGELRLDQPQDFRKVIKPGNLRGSAMVHRVLSDDPEEMMPPPASNLALTEKEKAILIKWVKQGAPWKDHWAFDPPVAMVPPELEHVDWPVQNQIDQFIFKRLEIEGLEPSIEADKERLLRRVTMDLTGLPPTIEEIDDFLMDQSDAAYEKVVDRLLESIACAERLTMDWLDLSRYADSHGMHADGWRGMWPWRDWVIEAFRENMPYDQFVTWQLAGDLLPDATRDQKLATAFHRNHPMTAEGGVIDEEFRLNYVFDRTETTGTAFLGLTMNCARCHDHKFDPISQKDYYQLTAFFNNIRELGMTGDDGNFGPMLPLMDGETEAILKQLDEEVQQTSLEMESKVRQLLPRAPQLDDPGDDHLKFRVGYFPLDKMRDRRRSDLKDPGQQEGPVNGVVLDNNPKAYSSGLPELVTGRLGQALKFRGEYDELHITGFGNLEWTEAFSGGMWINTSKREADKTQTLMGTSGQKNNFWRGWDLYLDQSNRLNFRFIHSLPHNYIHLKSEDSISINNWNHVFFTYDGSGKAKGIKLFLDGKAMAAEVMFDHLYKTARTVDYGSDQPNDRAVRVAKSYRAFTGEDGVFKGLIDEIELYKIDLTPLEVSKIYLSKVGKPVELAGDNELPKLHWVYRQPEMQVYRDHLKDLRKRKLEAMNSVPEVMVMEEMPQPRVTYAFKRGIYSNPMYEVTPQTPGVLGEFPKDLPRNRLGLAKWLFDSGNPLTARVTVNRYWQMVFGTGLVKTPQDFGVQGALPTHPELLDYLALYLQDQQWEVRALLKLMVMSHTYRQSSKVTEDKWEKDPDNQLLARGTSYRLPAEMIRDNALAASGLLVNQIGGKSVRPYQPEGLWIDKGNFSQKLLRYKVTLGDSLYRRSMYTFIKRTSPHPAMTAFDAPNRDVCTVKRETTNTPLQALVLMNDPQFVECSRVLAERVQKESNDTLERQIIQAFRLVTGRKPKLEEVEIFGDLYHRQYDRFLASPSQIDSLLAVGEYPFDPALEKARTAALTVVASTMINHDEAYMKR